MHFHCEMAVARHEVVTKSATHVTLIRGQPCSVAVALNAVGDPRLLPTRKQDDLTLCVSAL